ncbi:MAG TPA: hypothetical protein ENH32_06295 [Proteobacteria bacterium]|nr:hypothetical protein BMS3Abin14_00843 [bacterium BMS3Abin14]HDL53568.1 hypothetical protein [Pseudomonadota bacterium]
MICTILKEEIDCIFMTRQGCTYNGGHCEPVVQACEGCGNAREIEDNFYCVASANPAAKWNIGVCNYATHVEKGNPVIAQAKINPLKASKRAGAHR